MKALPFKASYRNVLLEGIVRWPLEKTKLNLNTHVTLKEGQAFSSSRLGSASKPSPDKGTRRALTADVGVGEDAGMCSEGSRFSRGKGSPVSTAEGPCRVMVQGCGLRMPDGLQGFRRAAAPACVCSAGLALHSQWCQCEVPGHSSAAVMTCPLSCFSA